MSLLNAYELDITKELLSIALANAADSFSKMANEKVLIREYNLSVLKKEELANAFINEHDPDWYVLTTDIVGKLEGKSYLLFNQVDADKIFDMFTPGQISKPGQLSELQEGILLELDNIITASMVTQLSNFLSLATHGDVPNLKHLSRQDVLAYFKQDVEDFDVILNIRARFQSYQSNMKPSFVCFFKSEFLLAIKHMIATDKHLSLLKK